MKPSLGRIVIHRGLTHNGASEHPAIITRVLEDPEGLEDVVNLTVFPDGAAPVPMASQSLIDPADESQAIGWFWPPRVEG